ncbi:PQQ-dependent dehydrogenase (s-GDH family) [Pasteurella langaaensis DSM 22999]|uniref:PQQ-dependent dehydrogenase (S-GDH family) n=1 Tax=Alitibacter langaaensis DSM 22999 TaxID=1122935 RepID=A0A2U0T8A5_9PAST|nr:PQQ-dependent dehydrogenase (s-GDH family) [Pasteurella langaaensis DSM 22999]
MLWGPDNFLWVTERQGKSIDRINPETGEKHTLITLDNVFIGPQHEGLLGLALAPDFLKPNSKNYVYAAYTYKDGEKELAKIVRFEYDEQAQKLGKETAILDRLPASNDHNAGRLIFGPDEKLYYTIGDMGHNQGKNLYKENEAQRTPTKAEIAKGDFSAYVGSSLRLNADGSIPADNPVINGVKSHLFTYGHRNPQGLVFVGNTLYSSEQGPSSDDEVNILKAGKNYGWPHVAGYQDNQAYEYVNYSTSKVRPKEGMPTDVKGEKETDWHHKDFEAPVKSFYTVSKNYSFSDATCGEMAYICWPTIAPGSVTYYPKEGSLKTWDNSLVVTSLKNGQLYVLPLNADGTNIRGDVKTYFHSNNRYRKAVINPDTKKIYVATDVAGNVMGLDGKVTDQLANPGSILVFEVK